MNMRALLVIVGGVCLVFSTAYSQQGFKKGFIVLSGGDTVSGLINCKAFRSMPQNPTFIKFKVDPADKALIFRVADLSNFEIPGMDIYARANILAEDIIDYEDGEKHASSWMQNVWLRLVVKGDNVSLYKWNGRFYIKIYGAHLIELKHGNYDSPSFKQQLGDIAAHYRLSDELSKNIEQCRFNSNDLSYIIVLLNRGKARIIPLYPPTCIVSFFAGMGMGVGGVDVYTMTNAPTIHFTNGGLSNLSIGAYLSSNFTTLFLRFELAYSSGSYLGQGLHSVFTKAPQYEYSQKTIATSISILNKFYTNGVVEYYGGLNINQNFSIYNRNFTDVLLNGAGFQRFYN